jgi:hypothetical protein
MSGVHQFDDLELKDPILRVRSVNYNAETRVADIEVLAREGESKFEH